MSRNRSIGTNAETKVAVFLQEQGWPNAERRALAGAQDKGDITGVSPALVVEVKACREMKLAEWVDEAKAERSNARAEIGVVWHKRRGKGSPGDWYVSMDGQTFADLLDRAGLR